MRSAEMLSNTVRHTQIHLNKTSDSLAENGTSRRGTPSRNYMYAKYLNFILNVSLRNLRIKVRTFLSNRSSVARLI